MVRALSRGPDFRAPKIRKNPRAHKNKIGTSPPPPPSQNTPPPKTRNFMDMGFSCRENTFFPGVHKIGAAISGPRIADTNFTDTERIFLRKKNQSSATKTHHFREAPVRFGPVTVTVWRWNGSSGSGYRFRRFLCKKFFFSVCFSTV